jgi:hypothetical protein
MPVHASRWSLMRMRRDAPGCGASPPDAVCRVVEVLEHLSLELKEGGKNYNQRVREALR